MAKLLTGTRIYGTGTVDTQLFVSGTNSATSTTTGALQVVGGVGVGGNLHVGGIIYGAILGTATTATNADNVKTVLQTANAAYYPAFVDSNNSTAAYETLYTTASFYINPVTPQIVLSRADSSAQLVLQNTTSTTARYPQVVIQNFDSFGGMGVIELQRGRGNSSIPQSVLSGDLLGGFNTWGHNGGSMIGATRINGVADSTFSTTASAYLSFLTTFNSVQTEKVRITAAGNVGIGTASPSVELEVAGSAKLTGTNLAIVPSTTTNPAYLVATNAGGNFFFGIDNNTGASFGAGTYGRVLYSSAAYPMSFFTNGAERLRITANGGISFGASGTAYGVSGQILQSNGDAAPTWISTGSLAAANATTATHLSGGVAGQIPYQTAPGVTAFLSTGTAGDVLVSNGSSAATYNNTLRLAGATNATSTTTGALQVVGGVGVGGDLFIQGDIRTNDTLFNLINANATTVNFAGDATALTMGATSGSTNVRNNLTVSGNLTVQGTTTIVDSTVTNIADPIITLGGGTGNTAPTADDNKDRGVAFKWVNNSGTTSTGFFGYDDSTGYLTYIQTATITNEVVSGTKGAMDVNLAGGTAMSIHYQSAADTTAFLAAGSSGFLLQTNGTGSAPTWVSASGVSAGSATNADNIRTIAQTASASYFPTFVDSNNASNAYESVYTTGTFVINPATGYIGMGTASPSRPLHVVTLGSTVQGIAAFEANASGLAIQDNGSQNGNVEIVGYKQSSSTYHNILLRGSSSGLLVQNTTGNVGIGNLTPIAKLHIGAEVEPNMSSQSLFVQGSKTGYAGFKGLPQGQLLIYDDTASTAGSGGAIGFGANTGASQRTWIASINSERDSATNDATNYAGSLVFYTRPAQATPEERVRITSTGNVGIGTSSPAYKLEVASGTSGQQSLVNFRTADSTTANNAGIQIFATPSATATSRSVTIVWDADGANSAGVDYFVINKLGNSGEVQLQQYSNAAMSFTTNSTERLRITAAGGISFGATGTAYGTSGQVLKSNGDAAPTWVDPSTLASASATNADNIRTVAQTAAASYYPTFVDSNNASNAYELVYTTSSFSINPSNGNIQIGMTGQDYQPSSGGNHTIRLNAANTSSIGFHDSGSTIASIKFSGAYGFEIGAYDGVYGPHNTILHGNVGIGTQSPGAKLDIKLAADGDFLVGRYSAGTAKLVYAYQSGSDGYLELRTGADVIVTKLSGYTATPSYFLSNVGVGTTSTSAKLHVTSTGEIARFESSGGSGRYVRFNDSGATKFNFIIGVQQNVDNGFEITPSTTAGGSTFSTPALAITSAGGISFGGTASYGSSGQILQSNGNAAPTWIALSSRTVGTSTQVTTVAQTANATYYPTLVDSNNTSAAAESLYTTSSFNINPATGRVGIGSTTPQTSLDVRSYTAGTTIDNGVTLWNPSGANDTPIGIRFSTYGDETGNQYPKQFIGAIRDGAYGGGKGSIVFCNRDANDASIVTLTDERMRILPGGNVGIGVTSPSTRLDIADTTRSGSTNISGTVLYATSNVTDTQFIAQFRHQNQSQGIGFSYNSIRQTGSNTNENISLSSRGTGNLSLRYDSTDSSVGTAGLTLLGTNGNVGIGTTAPDSKLHVEVGNATAYTPANTLVSGQTARISNTDATSGVSANLLFVAKGAGGGNGLGSISGVNTGVGSLAFTFGTRHSSSNVTERMRITSDGNVVIGATTTTNKFEVAGTAGQLFSVSDSFTGTIFAASDVSGIPSIEVLDTGLVKLAQYNGAVTIGTGTVSSSTAELSVYGMLYTSGPQGEIRASNEITAYFSSDRRLKENIKLIENPITIIDQIRGVTFDWTDEHMARRGGEDGYFVRKHDIGVIAQEVQAVLPELVGTREDGYLAVKYEKMVPLLIEAIKEQQKSIDMLKFELEKLKNNRTV
jgi:hypothetical protein